MGLEDLFAEDVAPPLDAAAIPDDSALRTIARAARELAVVDARLKRIEALAEAARTRRHKLATRVLPELLDAAGVDTFGLSESNCDVVVSTRYHAAIKVDWDDVRRANAFHHLEERGGGDLVKAELAVSFAKEDLAPAKVLLALCQEWIKKKNLEAGTTLDLSVNWRSLTSWVREEMERPTDPHAQPSNMPPLDLDRIGASAWRECAIVPRKVKKPGRGRARS